jgi:hypothetical protein
LDVQPSAAAACATCIATNTSACNLSVICGSMPECVALEACTFTCGPYLDCQQECLAAFPGEKALFAAYKGWSCRIPCKPSGDWSCTGHLIPVGPRSGISFEVEVYDSDYSMPLPGVHVALCGHDDLDCSNPVDEVDSGADGSLTLLLQNKNAIRGFDGYLLLKSAATLRLRHYWGFALSKRSFALRRDASGLSGIALPTQADLEELLAAVSTPPDPTRGVLTIVVADCRGEAAPDVEVSIAMSDARTVAHYAGNTHNRTDRTGQVLFANVPPGVVQLSAKPDGLGQPSTQITVVVEAGAITSVRMLPDH